ncbi:AAA domain-containing protein [Micromonospora haikouensis]|uniref:DEAD/DEAH box helicase n=1 Tax=Micromonospora haikouensis TaxID=686309 RepID=UPI0034156796
MKLQALQHGATTTLVLRTVDQHRPAEPVEIGHEATLSTARTTGDTLLVRGRDVWRVQGHGPADQDQLDKVLDGGGARLAWVSDIGPGMFTVQVHRFAYRLRWEEELVFGVDDRGLAAAARLLPAHRRIDQVTTWLADQFLIPPPAGTDRAPRFLASAAPDRAVALDRGFRLHGSNATAHIENQDGQLWLRTLRRPTAADRRSVALTLVEAPASFRDETYAGVFRQRHQTDFTQLLGSGRQYLNHWDEYSEKEVRQVVERAVGLGVARYLQVRRVDSRTYRFHLDPDGGPEFLARLGEEHTDLAAHRQAPDGLRDHTLKLEDRASGDEFSGEVTQFNAAACTISLQAPQGREVTPPPPTGELYLSVNGDRVRINRQRRARRLIEELRTPMPQLGPILEGQPVPAHRVPTRTIQPRELTAFRKYRDFTAKQEDAVRIALNTPDIALIQGPPGTGKTRVITAIQECLAQLRKEAGNVGHSVLLTSFQHDAVDEVVRRTEVLGLPAVKVTARRREGDDHGVRDWCVRKSAELRAALPAEGQLLTAVRTVEALVVGYGRQPPAPERTADLIAQIDGLVGGYLPVEIRSRLTAARTGLTTAGGRTRFAVDDLTPLRRSIAAIRVDPVAFADDGPHMARKALLRLSAQPAALADADRALLEQAATFESAGSPPFLDRLAVLRDRLLDLATPVTAPVRAVADDDLIQLFSDVVKALRDHLMSSADGATAAVAEFLDELEHDPEGVAEAIRNFTTVLASTCQQASSNTMAEHVRGNQILFDTVIVDEAARASPLDLMIPLCLATRRIILVGDHRQLPHLLEPDIERELESSAADEMLTALRQSMFERLFRYLREARARGEAPREITLDTQFRMHQVLGEFVSSAFYADDTALHSGTDSAALRHGVERYGDAVAVWADLPHGRHGGETSGRSKSRPAEARWIADELTRLSGEVPPDLTFGVVAFYRAQVQAVWAALDAAGLAARKGPGRYEAVGALAGRLHVGTVDAFQGREFDVVLLSVTRSNKMPGGEPRANRRKYGHLLLANRLCVAMSRQKRLLVAVGDAAMFDTSSTGGEVRGLVEFRRLCEGRWGRVVSQ